MNNLNKQIALRIRWTRENQGYTREDFEAESGISAKFLYKIETGQKGFSVHTLLNICKALNVTPDYILFGTEDVTEEILFLIHQIDPKNRNLVVALITAVLKNKN